MAEHENAIDRFTDAIETWISGEINKRGVRYGELTHEVWEKAEVGNSEIEELEMLNHAASEYMREGFELARIRLDISSFMESITERLSPYRIPSAEILFPKSDDSEFEIEPPQQEVRI